MKYDILAKTLRTKWNKFSDLYVSYGEKESLESIKKNINKYFSNTPKKINYMELACGSGILSEYITKSHYNKLNKVDLYDLSDEMIKKAKIRLKNTKIENLLIEQKNCYDIKIEKNKYDLIIASLILHLLNDPKLMIGRIKKMLKKDGVFLISILAPLKENSFFYKQNEIFGKYLENEKKEDEEHDMFKLAEGDNLKGFLDKFGFILEDFYVEKALVTNQKGDLVNMFLERYDLGDNRVLGSEEKKNFVKDLEGLAKDTEKIPLEWNMYNYYVKNT